MYKSLFVALGVQPPFDVSLAQVTLIKAKLIHILMAKVPNVCKAQAQSLRNQKGSFFLVKVESVLT